MSQGKSVTVTKIKDRNKKAEVTIPSTSVHTVLVDGRLLPDPIEVDPGVVQ